jgi:CTP synthase
VPYLKAAGESKTKPTQHSVGELRKIGIQPDVLICRTERELPKDEAEKIAQFCNVERRAVIEERDKDYTIYEVPLSLVNNRLDDLVVEKLNLTHAQPLQIDDWRQMVESMRTWDREINVAVVGKYVKHHDAYKSVYEALVHAGIANRCRVNIRKVEAEKVEQEGAEKAIGGADALLVPGGFDKRGILGKLDAIRYARERNIPFFGICLGLQVAAIEFARNVLGLTECNSTEFNPNTPDPVVCLLDEQRKVTQVGGTMRLGSYDCRLVPRTRAHAAYAEDVVSERHRHRFEFNNDYRARFEAAGVVFSGMTLDGSLVEVLELPEHPWFVAVQCHPEFKSKPTRSHPLFRDFVAAGLAYRAEKKADPGRNRGHALAGAS